MAVVRYKKTKPRRERPAKGVRYADELPARLRDERKAKEAGKGTSAAAKKARASANKRSRIAAQKRAIQENTIRVFAQGTPSKYKPHQGKKERGQRP